MARDGAIGKEVYDQVNKAKAKSPEKTLTEIFKEVAEKRGATAGTTAANYYRVVRANGAAKPRRLRKASASAQTTRAAASRGGRRNGAAEIDRLTVDLVKSVTALAEAVKAQGKDVAELRSRLDGVRKVIS